MTVTLMTMTSEVVRRHPRSRSSRQVPSPTTETQESTRPRRDRDNTWRIRTLSVSTPASINPTSRYSNVMSRIGIDYSVLFLLVRDIDVRPSVCLSHPGTVSKLVASMSGVARSLVK